MASKPIHRTRMLLYCSLKCHRVTKLRIILFFVASRAPNHFTSTFDISEITSGSRAHSRGPNASSNFSAIPSDCLIRITKTLCCSSHNSRRCPTYFLSFSSIKVRAFLAPETFHGARMLLQNPLRIAWFEPSRCFVALRRISTGSRTPRFPNETDSLFVAGRSFPVGFRSLCRFHDVLSSSTSNGFHNSSSRIFVAIQNLTGPRTHTLHIWALATEIWGPRNLLHIHTFTIPVPLFS